MVSMQGHIGIMEKKMETTIVYWGDKGIVEKKMETTIVWTGKLNVFPRNCLSGGRARLKGRVAAHFHVSWPCNGRVPF